MLRADHQIAKSIYQKDGLQRLQWYQKLPYVEVSIPDPIMGAPIHPPYYENMPWDEMIVRFINPNDNDVYMIISKMWKTEDPTARKNAREISSPDLAIEVFDAAMQITVSVAVMSEHSSTQIYQLYVNTQTGQARVGACSAASIERDEHIATHTARMSIWICNYLTKTPDHLVQVKPVMRPSKHTAKTMHKKPWLREDLPKVIVINPLQARKYGHRIDRGGSHASPIPHQRRGHWRILRSARWGTKQGSRVWIKPAWIGDREWVFHGNRYKVITDHE